MQSETMREKIERKHERKHIESECLRKRNNVKSRIEKRSEEIQMQERERKIAESTYAMEFGDLILKSRELPTYLMDNWRKMKNKTSIITRFRLGWESRLSQY